MVVRRSPGKKIRIVHISTRQVLEMKILDVDHSDGRAKALVEFVYQPDEFSVQAHLFTLCQDRPSAVYLQNKGDTHLRSSSGDEMTIQMAGISSKDVNIRLVDPNRLFEFQWSDRRLTV